MKDVISKVYKKTQDEFFVDIDKELSDHNQKVIVTANPEIMMFSEGNEELYKELINERTLITADGIGVVKAYKKLFKKDVSRITGVEIVEHLLSSAEKNKYRVLIYGTKQEVLDKLITNYENDDVDIQIKAINGYDYDVGYVREAVLDYKPNIVLLCLGVPRQELVAFELAKSTNDVIYIGCGGSIDVLSGSIKRAPDLVQKLNLEWLYRIAKQPKRITRFFNNQIKFAFKVYFK